MTTPQLLNTHGLKPGRADARLFTIEGWTLLVELTPNDDDEGLGVRYTTTLDSGLTVSMWVGNSNDNDKTNKLFGEAFDELDDEKATKWLQMLFDQCAPIMRAEEKGDA